MTSYDLAAAARGKHVFVAGGSSGINLGIADVFARCGAKISLCSRKADRVAAAVAQVRAHGSDAWGGAADVRDYAQVEAALRTAKEMLGPIDVLISGAAGNFVAPALGMSSNAFRTVVEIDLIGTFNVARAGFEFLRKPGASFIAISAPQALHPYAYQAHVNAAKAGIDMLTKTLAVEWGPEGVRCNAIIPGPIADTEGMARLAPTEAERKLAREGTPLLRYVAGMNQLTARRLYDYRTANGPLKRREQLKEVPGFGEATYVQAAGFLKITGGDQPLDSTWIHPESYEVAHKVLERVDRSEADLAKKDGVTELAEQVKALELAKLADELQVGQMTLADIVSQFTRPGRDPREDLPERLDAVLLRRTHHEPTEDPGLAWWHRRC